MKTDFQVVDSICPRGEGPEEYLDPTVCEYNYTTGNLSILESGKSLLREISIAESLQTGLTVVKEQRSYRASGKYLWNLFSTNSGKELAYVVEGMTYAYYQIEPGKQLTEDDLRSVPIELAELYKPNAIYMTQSLSTLNPEKGVTFVSYANMCRFDLISVEEGLLNTLYFKEKKTANEAADAMKKILQWYNWDIASTKEYIYLGYALEERMDEEEELEQTHILVFDWEGNPVKHLHWKRGWMRKKNWNRLISLYSTGRAIPSSISYFQFQQKVLP
nr:BF3164 family lipoprotein [Porphyromonas gulae]